MELQAAPLELLIRDHDWGGYFIRSVLDIKKQRLTRTVMDD